MGLIFYCTIIYYGPWNKFDLILEQAQLNSIKRVTLLSWTRATCDIFMYPVTCNTQISLLSTTLVPHVKAKKIYISPFFHSIDFSPPTLIPSPSDHNSSL